MKVGADWGRFEAREGRGRKKCGGGAGGTGRLTGAGGTGEGRVGQWAGADELGWIWAGGCSRASIWRNGRRTTDTTTNYVLMHAAAAPYV